MSLPQRFVLFGSASAFIAVAAGAFAAHALKTRLAPEHLTAFETAARYQIYHAFGLLVTASLAQRGWRLAPPAGWLFLIGTLLFSGSLYLLALTGNSTFGMITPFGGFAFLGGWLCLVICAWPRRVEPDDAEEERRKPDGMPT
jgi:uncharacterized membrane protein YgdD (TMEM256/DUF423 family)